MKSFRICYLFIINLAMFTFCDINSNKSDKDIVIDVLDEILRNRIVASELNQRITIGDEIVYASTMLPIFYENGHINQLGVIKID